jgi:hypothetical protein
MRFGVSGAAGVNRRQFFGMTAAAVAAAGLPAFVLPRKTIFLPPKGGWDATEPRVWVGTVVYTLDRGWVVFDGSQWISPRPA